MSKDKDIFLRYSYTAKNLLGYQIVADGKVLGGPFFKRSEARTRLAELVGDHPNAKIVKQWQTIDMFPDD